MTTPILKLFAELVQNRSQRLQFDVSSPNGILLFREASKIICTYGNYFSFITIIFFKCLAVPVKFLPVPIPVLVLVPVPVSVPVLVNIVTSLF